MISALLPGLSGPLYQQLQETLRRAIVEGRLAPGQRLPASRELGARLGLSRNTVNAAYARLQEEGYLEARTGSGHFVAAGLNEGLLLGTGHTRPAARPPAPVLSAPGALLAAPTRPVPASSSPAFQTGLPDLEAFPFRAWSRLLHRHAQAPRPGLLKYQDQGGLPALKEALSRYLRLSRNVVCAPEQLVIVNGSQAGLDLLARLLLPPGGAIAIEEPGYLGAREAFAAAGARLLPVPVDEEGLDVDALLRMDGPAPRVVYTTPSCQFPSGGTLSLPRRMALLHWAERQAAYIIEDDYDSEFRFTGRPLSCLQGLDRQQRVIYLGTFSKVAFPGLRMGYLVLPEPLAPAFASALRKTGQDAPLLLQAAMADFLTSGQFEAHLRRMRKLYGRKQLSFVRLAQEHLSEWLTVLPQPAGMQLPCRFRRPVNETALLDAAARAGLVLAPLSRYYMGEPAQRGLFLGYTGVAEAHMERGVLLLRKVLREVCPPPRQRAGQAAGGRKARNEPAGPG